MSLFAGEALDRFLDYQADQLVITKGNEHGGHSRL